MDIKDNEHANTLDQLKNQDPEIAGEVDKVVINHVLTHLTLPTNVSSICVDGGYTRQEASGELDKKQVVN
jgi:hypothetical protein